MVVLRRDVHLFGKSTLPGLAGFGGGTTATPSHSLALPVPTPVAADQFDRWEVVPADSNIILTDPNDSSHALLNGAIRLYNSLTRSLLANIFSDEAGLPGLIPQYTGLSQG